MSTSTFSSPAKRRGRPRKGSNEGSQEEKRARGRQAQKTLQLRRQAAFAQLEKRNLGLEDTVEGMSNEFVKFGERAVMWSPKEQVLEDVKEMTEKFLGMAREAEKINQGQEIAAEEESPSKPQGDDLPSGNDASLFFDALSQNQIPNPSVPTDFDSLFNLSLPNLDRVSDTFPLGSSNGQFSPRLGFGLANTSIPNWPPANPWDQYYISGPKSFALHLYIDSVNLIVSVLRGELNIPGFIPSTARYYFRHGTPDRLIMLITLMVEKLTILDREGDEMRGEKMAMFSAVDYRLINEVVLGVVRELYTEEGELRDWLDPWGVQTYLVERWGVEFAGSVARIGVSVGGFGTVDPRLLARPSSEMNSTAESYVTVDLKSLIYKLAMSSVCFGEGPRYSKTKIDAIVQEQLNEKSSTF